MHAENAETRMKLAPRRSVSVRLCGWEGDSLRVLGVSAWTDGDNGTGRGRLTYTSANFPPLLARRASSGAGSSQSRSRS